MPPIDYTIPGQFQRVQLEPPENAMARAMQMRGLQESAQMNALKMQEYQQKQQEAQQSQQDKNRLAQILKVHEYGTPEFISAIQKNLPHHLPTVLENIDKFETAKSLRTKREEETTTAQRKNKEARRAAAISQIANAGGVDEALELSQAAFAAGDIDQLEVNSLLKELYNAPDMTKFSERRRIGLLDPDKAIMMPYDIQKATSEVSTAKLKTDTEAAKALSEELNLHRQMFNPLAVNTPEQAAAHTAAFYDNPKFAPYANKMMTKEQAVKQSSELFRTNKNAWLDTQINLSGDKMLEATERREKETKAAQARAYSDHVFDALNRGEEPMTPAAFFAQQQSAPAAPAAAPAAAAPAAAAPAVAAPAAAAPAAAAPAAAAPAAAAPAAAAAPDGERMLPGVETVAGIPGVHPVAAALYRTGDPRDKITADAVQAAYVKTKEGSKATVPTSIQELNAYLAMSPEDKAAYEKLQKIKGTNLSVGLKLGPQEEAFEAEVGKGQAKLILENKVKAEDARDMLDTARIGRNILKSGAITGAGADFFVGLNQALKTAGMDFGYADASANSQAYSANMAQNVGKLIKLFGAGTGLSNADRDYAEKMAGGKIALDRSALEKILDIQERAAQNVIKRYNKSIKNVKSKIDLAVELEPEAAAPSSKAPAIGTITDGYRFKGGNPADAKNWEKVK